MTIGALRVAPSWGSNVGDPKEEMTSMRGRRSIGVLIALSMLAAAACSNEPTPPTQPSPTQDVAAGGTDASGSQQRHVHPPSHQQREG